MKAIYTLLIWLNLPILLLAQNKFNYQLEIRPITLNGLPGLHSHVVAQHEGKWLLIGGRKDGIHARQPFNAFPAAQANTDIYVVDLKAGKVWSASTAALPTAVKEQMQSNNMNYIQDGDTLYMMGGYGFSASANVFKTFPMLSTVRVSGLINAITGGSAIQPYFNSVSDTLFAITGGQLGKLGNYFMLAGGHRFDGRYNPQGPDHGPGFTQVYANQIRYFTIHNEGNQLSYRLHKIVTDQVHLHRRDYNLVPHVKSNGDLAYTISSGVFQPGVDLPYLYPVDADISGITPVTATNQYLSNYHSAKAALYDDIAKETYMIFFGGIARYYYDANNDRIQDDNAPFVKTISMFTRAADGTYTESRFPVEMPALTGASAEFIVNQANAHIAPQEIIELSKISADTILVGHIVGGILSPSLNPFTQNQTNTTSADAAIYEVKLIRSESTGLIPVSGANPYKMTVFPNPADSHINVSITAKRACKADYFFTNSDGKIMANGSYNLSTGPNNLKIGLTDLQGAKLLLLTVVIDNRFFLTEKVNLR